MERKKWYLSVLTVVMICVASTANAQVRIGVKGGYNLATVKFNKDVLHSENINGFHVGPVLEFMPKAGIGFDVALLYSRKGFYSEELTRKGTFMDDYLEVPVNLKCKIGLPVVAPFFAAGPYVSFRVAGDKLKDIVDIDNVKSQLEAESFGAGLNFTAGVEVLSRIQVGLTYDLGLTDNYKSLKSDVRDLKGKEHTWLISATLLF